MVLNKDGRGENENSIANLEEYNNKRKKSNKECIEALREADELVEGKLSLHDYRELDISPSYATICDRLGSWNEGKKKAGLEVTDSAQDVYERGPPEIISITQEKWENMNKHQRYRKRNQAKWAEYKIDKGCKECGYNEDPRALEFHHTDGRDGHTVSALIAQGYSNEFIKNEVNKCIVLCCNCHKIETIEQEYNVG